MMLKLRGIDPGKSPGAICSWKKLRKGRIALFSQSICISWWFHWNGYEADIIDEFVITGQLKNGVHSRPAHIINDAIKAKQKHPREKNQLSIPDLYRRLCDSSLEARITIKNVQKFWQSYRDEETRMLELIKSAVIFHEQDPQKGRYSSLIWPIFKRLHLS